MDKVATWPQFLMRMLGVGGAKRVVASSRNISKVRHASDRILNEVYPKLEELRASGVRGDRFREMGKEIMKSNAMPIIEEASDSILGNIKRLARKHPVGEIVTGQVAPPDVRQRWEMFRRYGGHMGARNPEKVLSRILPRMENSRDAAAFESGWKNFVPDWYHPMSPSELDKASKVRDVLSF